jgi:hypothetical protein
MRSLPLLFLLACGPRVPTDVAAESLPNEVAVTVKEIYAPPDNTALLFVVDTSSAAALTEAGSLLAQVVPLAANSAQFHLGITTMDASACDDTPAPDGRCGRFFSPDSEPAVMRSESLGDQLLPRAQAVLAALPTSAHVARAFDAADLAVSAARLGTTNSGFFSENPHLVVIFVSGSPECSGSDTCDSAALADPQSLPAPLVAADAHVSIGTFASVPTAGDPCAAGDPRFAAFTSAINIHENASICDSAEMATDGEMTGSAVITLDAPPVGGWDNVQVERKAFGASGFVILPRVATQEALGWSPADDTSDIAQVVIHPFHPGDTLRVSVLTKVVGH